MTIEDNELPEGPLSDDEIIDRMAGPEDEDTDVSETETDIENEADEDEGQDDTEDESDDETEGDEESDNDNGDGEDDDTEDPETEIQIGDTVQKIKRSEIVKLVEDREYHTKAANHVRNEARITEDVGLYLAKVYEDKYNAAYNLVQTYSKYDDFQAQSMLSPEDFEAWREGKKAAIAELDAVGYEAKNYIQVMQTAKQARIQEQVPRAVAEIQRRLPTWNDTVYSELQTYAISKGMDVGMFNEIIDPAAIEMMHIAMKAEKAKATVSKKVVKKEVKAPKGVIGKSNSKTNSEATNAKKLMNRATQTRSDDDIIAAMLALNKNNS